MTELLSGFWNYGVMFLVILTVVVFVHEMGHFLLARLNGVKVETFSVGFGPELVGFTSKSGTRWKICALPIGGYVKMLGDMNAASVPGDLDGIPPAERSRAFPAKKLWQRASIVAAGPIFNLLFGFLLFAILFQVHGETRLQPVIGGVLPDSAAAEAGLKAGDRILEADGQKVDWFRDLQRIITLSVQEPVTLVVERGGARLNLAIYPRIVEERDAFGNVQKYPRIGVRGDGTALEVVRHGPISALGAAGRETLTMVSSTLKVVGQMLTGARDTSELSGPIRIAKGAGQAAQLGVGTAVFYTILLSVNLGLFNLFPVPLLDGGHLLFYGIEALRGKPLGARTQEYGFRLGLFLVLALMVLATRNDLVDLKVWDFIKNVVS